MFALRFGAVARLARTPVSMKLMGVRPLSTPALTRRTFLTSARVNEPAATKAKETKSKATKDTAKKTPAKKPAAKKKAAPKNAKKVVAKKKPKKVEKASPPKIDKKLLKAPKRPPTPFLVWYAEESSKLEKVKTVAELRERSIEHGIKWKSVPESVKETYRQKHAEDLREWTQRYAEWYNRLTPEQLKAAQALRKKSRLPKPAGQPTRPPSPYISYYLEYRQNHPEVPMFDASKESAKEWKALPQETRDVYQQRFQAAIEQYQKDLDHYKKSYL